MPVVPIETLQSKLLDVQSRFANLKISQSAPSSSWQHHLGLIFASLAVLCIIVYGIWKFYHWKFTSQNVQTPQIELTQIDTGDITVPQELPGSAGPAASKVALRIK